MSPLRAGRPLVNAAHPLVVGLMTFSPLAKIYAMLPVFLMPGPASRALRGHHRMSFKKVTATDEGASKSAAAGVEGASKSLLYIEDEDLNWEIAENELSRKYKMARAATDKEAFRILMREKFDVILMDVQLSGSALNGIDITKILKGKYDKEPPPYAKMRAVLDTPVVVVTAYASTYTRDVVIQLGADDIIYKPVNFSNLSLVLSRMLMRSVRRGA